MNKKNFNYHDSRWKKFSINIKKRDGFLCRNCRAFGKFTDDKATILNVHHMKPINEAPEEIFNIKNCITLCSSCHDKCHDRKNRQLTEFGENIKYTFYE